MNTCPITYKNCGDDKYLNEGLKKLSSRLKALDDFPYTLEEQWLEARGLAAKLSIQGVQVKMSARMNTRKQQFEPVEKHGEYTLKPQSPDKTLKELPENEDLTMHLASVGGLEVPLHGLHYCKDGSLIYFIKRFDRGPKKEKFALEDFAQLLGESRDNKYDATMERVARVIDRFCSIPAIEKVKLFRLTLFSFLVGNEDMHLKNFSLITRNGKVELSPSYDLLNSTLLNQTLLSDEMALRLNGKILGFSREDFVEYYGREVLALKDPIINQVLTKLETSLDTWKQLIKKSFLSPLMKEGYTKILEKRFKTIFM
ncbi:MAG: serine/threonine-protein kinase HipA [Chlamydiales bacterium]|jgi:serine/threonine-protein kinase HipA